MKTRKVLLGLLVVMSFASCKKAYNCSCETSVKQEITDTQSGNQPFYTKTTKSSRDEDYSEKMSQKQATAACSSMETMMKKQLDEMFKEGTDNGYKTTYTTSATCKLK